VQLLLLGIANPNPNRDAWTSRQDPSATARTQYKNYSIAVFTLSMFAVSFRVAWWAFLRLWCGYDFQLPSKEWQQSARRDMASNGLRLHTQISFSLATKLQAQPWWIPPLSPVAFCILKPSGVFPDMYRVWVSCPVPTLTCSKRIRTSNTHRRISARSTCRYSSGWTWSSLTEGRVCYWISTQPY